MYIKFVAILLYLYLRFKTIGLSKKNTELKAIIELRPIHFEVVHLERATVINEGDERFYYPRRRKI